MCSPRKYILRTFSSKINPLSCSLLRTLQSKPPGRHHPPPPRRLSHKHLQDAYCIEPVLLNTSKRFAHAAFRCAAIYPSLTTHSSTPISQAVHEILQRQNGHDPVNINQHSESHFLEMCVNSDHSQNRTYLQLLITTFVTKLLVAVGMKPAPKILGNGHGACQSHEKALQLVCLRTPQRHVSRPSRPLCFRPP